MSFESPQKIEDLTSSESEPSCAEKDQRHATAANEFNDAEKWLLSHDIKIFKMYEIYPFKAGILDRSKKDLVVLYTANHESWTEQIIESKPTNLLMVPLNTPVIAPSLSFNRDEEAAQFASFVALHGYVEVFELMNDPSVLLLMKSEDTTCIFPSVILSNQAWELSLVIFRYYDGGESVANCKDPNFQRIFRRDGDGATVVLASGREIHARIETGWFKSVVCGDEATTKAAMFGCSGSSTLSTTTSSPVTIRIGTTFSSTDVENGYGSLGALVTKSNNLATSEGKEFFFLTCEHVFSKIETITTSSRRSTFRAPPMLQFPSIGYRKAQVIQEVMPGKILSIAHVEEIGKRFVDTLLRSPPHALANLFTDLQGLQAFIHNQMNVQYDEMVKLDTTITKSINGLKGGTQSIDVNGDVQLMKIHPAALPTVLTSYENFTSLLDYPIDYRILKMQDVADLLTELPQCTLHVIKPSAINRYPNEGLIHRTCHLADHDIFMKKTGTREWVGRILYNQLLIHADNNNFGISGDSGTMVFAEIDHVCYPLGIFIGSFTSTFPGYFIATPLEFVIDQGFELFVK